jgi:hypothetical protein
LLTIYFCFPTLIHLCTSLSLENIAEIRCENPGRADRRWCAVVPAAGILDLLLSVNGCTATARRNGPWPKLGTGIPQHFRIDNATPRTDVGQGLGLRPYAPDARPGSCLNSARTTTMHRSVRMCSAPLPGAEERGAALPGAENTSSSMCIILYQDASEALVVLFHSIIQVCGIVSVLCMTLTQLDFGDGVMT